MIARLWRGRAADAAKADAYVRHFTGTVSTELQAMAGHRGASLLRRDVDGGTEFIALTLWESRTVDRGLHRRRHLEVGGRTRGTGGAVATSTTSLPLRGRIRDNQSS